MQLSLQKTNVIFKNKSCDTAAALSLHFWDEIGTYIYQKSSTTVVSMGYDSLLNRQQVNMPHAKCSQ